MKVYLAGKINGLKNYKEVFAEYEKVLIKAGHQVMNPAVLPEGFPYKAYLPICMPMIDACEAVLMLPNWIDSVGAKIEKSYAQAQGIKIFYGPGDPEKLYELMGVNKYE